MAMARRKLHKGDIIEVTTEHGYGYIQYIGRVMQFGDVFRVLDVPHRDEITEIMDLKTARTKYYVCSLWSVLSDDARFRFCGGLPCQEPIPPLRRAQFQGWVIVDRKTGAAQPIDIRDEACAALSMEELVPADLLVERLSSNWSPRMDIADLSTVLADSAGRKRSARRTVFFIEFSNESDADKAANALRSSKFKVGEIAPTQLTVSVGPELAKEQVEATIMRLGGTITGRETEL